ncbi:hypothetical protein PRIC1_010423 [Phytophthora ramorum]
MSRDYLVERIAALVKMGRDLNAGELTSAAARYVIQVFWAKMLSVLVVNKFSTGMQYLGAVAYAHIEDDPAGSQAPDYHAFSELTKRANNPDVKPTGRKVKKQKTEAPAPDQQALLKSAVDFPYSRRAPPSVIFDMERVIIRETSDEVQQGPSVPDFDPKGADLHAVSDERRHFHCPATRTCDSAERGVDGPAETVEVEDEVTKSAEEEDEEEALERDNEEGSEATISPDATPSRGSSPRFTKSSPKLASKSSSKSK